MNLSRLLLPAACVVASLTAENASGFSIASVTVEPGNTIPPGAQARLVIAIATPSQPAYLYSPTEVLMNGGNIEVDVYPGSGVITAIGSLEETSQLGLLPPGIYEYEVRLHPEFEANWGARTNRGSFTVSSSEPPHRELHVVGIYSGVTAEGSNSRNNEEGAASVSVNRPGSQVTLFLSAYEPVAWHVTATEGTVIERVFLSGYYSQRAVGLDPAVPVASSSYEDGDHTTYLVAGWNVDSSRFLEAVPKIHALTGLEISSFHGSYAAPHPEPIVIDGVQDDPRLRSDYPQPVPPSSVPEAEFQMSFHRPNGSEGVFARRYTLQGPLDGERLLPAERVIPDGGSRYFYGAAPHKVWRVDSESGAVVYLDPGPDYPEVSWPMGVAFDGNVIVLVTLGGEGFLYHYDPLIPGWADRDVVTSLKNLDFECIEHHPHEDAFYAVSLSWGDEPARLYRSIGNGDFVEEMRLPILPFPVGPGGYRAELVSAGYYLALLLEKPPGPGTPGDSRIYWIDLAGGTAVLTHRGGLLSENRAPEVRIVSPEHGESFESPAHITLRALATDLDGVETVQTVEFFAGTNSLGFGELVETTPHGDIFELEWNEVPSGSYSLRARATDTRNAASLSDTVRVFVGTFSTLPTVTIEAIEPDAVESGREGEFRIHRIGPIGESLPVYYQVSGTASNGVDYVELSGQATIPAGSSTVSIPVTALEDNAAEGSETVRLELWHPPLGAPADHYVIGVPSEATVTIWDEDPEPAVLNIYASDPFAREPGASASGQIGVFTILRSGNTEHELHVNYSIGGTASNGVDYARIPASVVIPARARQAVIVIEPLADLEAEPRETVILRLEELFCPAIFPPPPGCYQLGPAREAVVHIADSSPSVTTVSIEATSPIAEESSEPFARPAFSGAFTVSRTGATTFPVSVYVRYSGTARLGLDVRGLPRLITIPEGETSTVIAVHAIPDGIEEGIETLVAEISACPPDLSPAPCYSHEIDPARRKATVFLRDDGITRASIGISRPPSGAQFHEGQTIPIRAIAIDLDGFISAIEFRAGNGRIGDSVLNFFQAPDPGTPIVHTFEWRDAPLGIHTLTAHAVTDTGTSIASLPVIVSVGDDPRQAVVVIRATDPYASEPGLQDVINDGLFTIRRRGDTNHTLTVFYSIGGTASNGVDYASIPNSVEIPAGQMSVAIPITPLGDEEIEGVETVVIRLEDPVCIAIPFPPGCYRVGPSREAVVFITEPRHENAEPPLFRLSASDTSLPAPVRLDFAGEAGRTYFIETSDDLVQWEAAGPAVETGPGSYEFADPAADASPHRFYRVVTP